MSADLYFNWRNGSKSSRVDPGTFARKISMSGILGSRLKVGSKFTFRLGCKSSYFLVQGSQLIDVVFFRSWKWYFIGWQRRETESIRSGNNSTESKVCLTYGVPRSKDRRFSSRDWGAHHVSNSKSWYVLCWPNSKRILLYVCRPQDSSLSYFRVKISHITMDLVVLPASAKITLGLGPQLCSTWIWMRPTGVWMVSVERDHAFWGQHLLQLGTRLDYSTMVSRVPCARISCCAVRLEG